MSKIAFIFPGQGAQYCGMGQDFYEQTRIGKETYDMASSCLVLIYQNFALKRMTGWILRNILRRPW